MKLIELGVTVCSLLSNIYYTRREKKRKEELDICSRLSSELISRLLFYSSLSLSSALSFFQILWIKYKTAQSVQWEVRQTLEKEEAKFKFANNIQCGWMAANANRYNKSRRRRRRRSLFASCRASLQIFIRWKKQVHQTNDIVLPLLRSLTAGGGGLKGGRCYDLNRRTNQGHKNNSSPISVSGKEASHQQFDWPIDRLLLLLLLPLRHWDTETLRLIKIDANIKEGRIE